MANILIVEDESIVALDIKDKLEHLGYNVLAIVSSGERAIEEVKKNQPDLILMDIILKGEIDGIETARQIRKCFDIPIIYLTAHSDEQTLKRAKVTEPFGYIIKPFVDDDLKSAIEIALYKHGMDTKLKYMGTHDPLTGLYNRAYFEEEILKLENGDFNPVGVIISDLDGLKLINDTLGHAKGDEILKCAAAIIKENFRNEDIVAKIGGDEFAVLLPKTSKKTLKNIYERINDSFKEYTSSNPEIPWSVSVGFATNEETDGSISEALKRAENNMYREKLNKSQSTHSDIVKVINKMLEERDILTASHLERLDKIVVKFSHKLRLSNDQITDLRLLARFHDIGKVGIPDNILFKPEGLEKEEKNEMQRHCEIGYRIASSSSQLYPIAEFILKHHEWWNGEGYPFGLKGEKIPLKSRIIAIVDAYDAMTTERPYRKALTQEEALNEIKKYSEIQFDPCLVDKFIEMVKEDGI